MTARAAAAVVVIAGAGAIAYLVARELQRGQGQYSYDDSPEVGFEWLGGGDYAPPSGEEYEVGGFDAVADAFLPVAYKVENVFYSVWGGRMEISLAGLAHLKQFEGLRLQPYKDVAGLWTIGYGHLLKPGEWWDSITEEFATRLLADDVGKAEDTVNSLVKVPLSQPQFDALVSFVYNVGPGAFRRSTLLRLLNAGDYAGAAAQLPLWRKAGGKIVQGLVNRRAQEVAMFNGGSYA